MGSWTNAINKLQRKPGNSPGGGSCHAAWQTPLLGTQKNALAADCGGGGGGRPAGPSQRTTLHGVPSTTHQLRDIGGAPTPTLRYCLPTLPPALLHRCTYLALLPPPPTERRGSREGEHGQRRVTRAEPLPGVEQAGSASGVCSDCHAHSLHVQTGKFEDRRGWWTNNWWADRQLRAMPSRLYLPPRACFHFSAPAQQQQPSHSLRAVARDALRGALTSWRRDGQRRAADHLPPLAPHLPVSWLYCSLTPLRAADTWAVEALHHLWHISLLHHAKERNGKTAALHHSVHSPLGVSRTRLRTSWYPASSEDGRCGSLHHHLRNMDGVTRIGRISLGQGADVRTSRRATYDTKTTLSYAMLTATIASFRRGAWCSAKTRRQHR